MKKSVFFLAAAAMAFAACNIEIVPENKVTFSAQCETSPASKAVLGINGESKPQTFWEFGDAINIFSSGSGETQSGVAGYQFVTSIGNKATSADFTCVDDGFVEGDLYYATYPYRNNKRGVNFTGADGTYRLAGLQIPASQTLAVGTFSLPAASTAGPRARKPTGPSSRTATRAVLPTTEALLRRIPTAGHR